MRVVVKFFSTLREIVDKKEIHIEMPNEATVEDLLKKLSEKYGEDFREYVYEKTGNIRPYLHLLIDGQSITQLQGIKTKLHDNCALAIFPPVGGGS